MVIALRNVAFALVSAAAVATLAGCASEAKNSATPRPAIVQHAQTASSPITETYAGEVRARYQSALGFRVGGKVQQRAVNVGDKVKKGQVLAILEPEDANLAVSSARAAVAKANADVSLAKAELDRHQAMLDKHFISQALFDARLNAWKAAQAGLDQANAQLAVSRNQADYTELRADADGAITRVSVEVGQVVAAGTPVFDLAHDGSTDVLIAVPESRIGLVKVDLPVVVQIWAQDDARFDGKVREVSPEADPRTRTYDVRVTVADATAVQLGMTARVYLNAGDAPNALLLPLNALHEKQGQPAVWVVDAKSNQVRLTPVTVGSYREEGVTVLSGIDTQQWVVVAGVHKLSEGQPIRPVDPDNKPIKL